MENALADAEDEWRKNYLKEVQVSRQLAKRLRSCEEKLKAALESNHPETPDCAKCLVLERELDIIRARHKSLIERYHHLEEELQLVKRTPTTQFLSPTKESNTPKKQTITSPPNEKIPIPVESPRKRLPSRVDIDHACQSVFRVNNNIPQVLHAASSATNATELFHHGILFGYPEEESFSQIVNNKAPSWLNKVLRSPPTSPRASQPHRKPKVMSVFPSASSLADVEQMMEFCFPHGDASTYAIADPSDDGETADCREKHTSFVVLLSGTQPAENMYAICVIPSNRPLWCFCLVSVHPFFSLFFKLLHGIVDMCAARAPQAVQVIFDDALRRLHDTAVPPMGGWCCFRLNPQHSLLTFHRPHTATARQEARQFILEYASPLLFSHVSLDHLLVLLGCLCCETKVLLISSNAALVTSCVLALRALLDPLEWAGVVVTILPPSLSEILEAPVPVLAGEIATSSPRAPISSVVQLCLDTNKLVMHEHEMRILHELKLPKSESLQYELQNDATQCFGCHITPQSIERNQVEACEHMSACIQSHLNCLIDGTLDSQHADSFLGRFHSTQMYSLAQESFQRDDADGCGNDGSDLEGEITTYEVAVN